MTNKGKVAAMILIGIALMAFLIVIFVQMGAFSPIMITNDSGLKSKTVDTAAIEEKQGGVEIIELPKASGNVEDVSSAFIQEAVSEELSVNSEVDEAQSVFSSEDLNNLANTYDENEF